jgi:hypothetical protein
MPGKPKEKPVGIRDITVGSVKLTESEHRVAPALRFGCGLEAEDGSAFAAKIAPLVLVQTHEQRQVWHGGIGLTAVALSQNPNQNSATPLVRVRIGQTDVRLRR